MTPFGAKSPRMKKLLEDGATRCAEACPCSKNGETHCHGCRAFVRLRYAAAGRKPRADCVCQSVRRRFSLGGGKPIFQFRGNKSMSEQRKTYADLKDELLITRDQIAVRVKEMGAGNHARLRRQGSDRDLHPQGCGGVFRGSDPRNRPADDDGFHGDFQLWQRDQVLRRGAHPIWTSRSTARTCSSSRTSSIPA